MSNQLLPYEIYLTINIMGISYLLRSKVYEIYDSRFDNNQFLKANSITYITPSVIKKVHQPGIYSDFNNVSPTPATPSNLARILLNI